MTWQLVGAEGKVERFVNSDNSRQFREVVKQTRVHDPSRTLSDGGDLRIEHPLCKAVGRADHINIADKVELRAVVEVNVAGSWVVFSRSQKGSEDAINRGWLYDSLLVKFSAQGKWSFTFIAPAPGTYRLRLLLAVGQRTRVKTYTAKSGNKIYQASWGTLTFNWRDMTKDVSIATPTDDGLEIISAPVTLAALEAKTWDPSFTDNADWGADCRDTAKFPNDGSDFCGGNGVTTWRVGNKFTITTLPATATVDQVDFQISVQSVSAATALLWDIDGYNGTGQGNPETDSAATMFAGCAITGVYVNDTTVFRTTGSKTFTALGATANADMEAARDAGTIFSIAIRETLDLITNTRCDFDEYTHATLFPTLTITYTEAGASLVFNENQRRFQPLIVR